MLVLMVSQFLWTLDHQGRNDTCIFSPEDACSLSAV